MSSDFSIEIGHRQIQLLKGDITQIAVDAVVNAANASLSGGGGVDGAIHRAAGPQIMQELDVIRARDGGCPTGSAAVTSGGNLPARFIFHAVGPRYRDGQHREPELLASCYSTCLNLAAEHELRSISFPSISTGVYGYPAEDAADIALRTVSDWVRQHRGSVSIVKLVQFSEQDHELYRQKALALRAAQANAAQS
jgi:O-acetyl-ADP-ribose deacetylase